MIKSGFIELVEPGYNVMTDRGFNIKDLLLHRNAFLNIKAFSDGKQLSAHAVKKSQQIASVCIHVFIFLNCILDYWVRQKKSPCLILKV